MRTIIALLLLIPTTCFSSGTLDTELITMWGASDGQDIIWRCNTYSKTPKHCKIVHTFIAKAESNLCRDATRHNCYGNSKYQFKANWEAHKKFNQTYNRFYYKNLTPSDFYSNTPKRKPKTRYCMSEESSGSPSSCPNGFNTAWQVYNKLINLN